MPELPEVETTKQGIKPHLEGRIITTAQVRNRKLRLPVPLNLNELCEGKHITAITRRGKYILLHMDKGYILIHLGMSGHLRIVSQTANPQNMIMLICTLIMGLLSDSAIQEDLAYLFTLMKILTNTHCWLI